MRVYVSGPVTGMPGLNLPAFEGARAALLAAGHEPVVPHDHVPEGATWLDAMHVCVGLLAGCDGVALLPVWCGSRGAVTEATVAEAHGQDVRPLDGWL